MSGGRWRIHTVAAALVALCAGLAPGLARGAGSESCWQGDGAARVWPQIVFRKAGDLSDYRRTMSQSRDEVRQMLTKDLVGVARELVPAGGNPKELVESVVDAVLAFDDVHDRHREQAVKGVPTFLEVSIRTALDELYRSSGVRPDRRRLRFVNADLVNRLKSVRAEMHSDGSLRKEDVATLRQVAGAVDLIPYGTFSSDGAQERVTLTLENVHSGAVCDFNATGDLEDVAYVLAGKVLRAFQAVDYPEVRNPNPNLTWLRPGLEEPTTASEARNYCASQGDGARLPYALELTTAASVGAEGASYVAGGIPRLEPGPWVVADRLRQNGQYFYFQPSPGTVDNDPAGPVRTSAGLGRINARFWCVRGEPGPRVARIERLYEIYRAARRTDPHSPALAAVEYLLNTEGALSARGRYYQAFPSTESAWAVLEKAGYPVAELDRNTDDGEAVAVLRDGPR